MSVGKFQHGKVVDLLRADLVRLGQHLKAHLTLFVCLTRLQYELERLAGAEIEIGVAVGLHAAHHAIHQRQHGGGADWQVGPVSVRRGAELEHAARTPLAFHDGRGPGIGGLAIGGLVAQHHFRGTGFGHFLGTFGCRFGKCQVLVRAGFT